MSSTNNARSNSTRSSGGGNAVEQTGNELEMAKTKMADTAKDAQGAAKQTAQEAMETTRETVTELAEQTQEQASEVIEQVSEQVTATIGEVREQATTTFTQQRDRAVSTLTALADALQQTGRNLEQQRQGVSAQDAPAAGIAPFIEDAAGRLSQSAEFLKDKDISGLFDEAQRLARKQPGLFLASMFGIGLAGARLLKGAMDANENQPGSGQSSQYGGGQSGQYGGSQYGAGQSGGAGQAWGQGDTSSMPSGFGGSSVASSPSVSYGQTDATRGASANALTGDGPFSDAGAGTTTHAPSNPSRTGYESTGSVSERETGSGLDAGNREPGGSTPGAGWSVDDTTNPTGDGQSVNTDTRLTERPGGGEGTTGGSAQSGYGAFDPDSLADEERANAVTGGDMNRVTTRGREERS
jgi:hypothetical protein